MDYKEKGREVHGCGKRICMGCSVIEAALRQAAADAYRDAAGMMCSAPLMGVPASVRYVALMTKAAALTKPEGE